MAPAWVNAAADPSAHRPIRVLIVDDHALVRDGIRKLLRQEPGLEVWGEAEGVVDAKRRIDALAPDIVIVDLMLKDGNGLDLIKWIGERHPDTKTIVATMHDERVYGGRALRAGASGFVSKQAPSRTIIEAIRALRSDRLCFSEALTKRILQRARRGDTDLERSPIEGLSDRELEVFRLMGAGRTTREIAERLHLGPSTVETYHQRLKHKLQIQNTAELRFEATRWALEQELSNPTMSLKR
ncbi:response regulator transcription factor [soil metagenome]